MPRPEDSINNFGGSAESSSKGSSEISAAVSGTKDQKIHSDARVQGLHRDIEERLTSHAAGVFEQEYE